VPIATNAQGGGAQKAALNSKVHENASIDARRKAALGLDMGDPSSLETLSRTHILIMALDAVIDELPPDADVEALVGSCARPCSRR
jgi:hypothetical protein